MEHWKPNIEELVSTIIPKCEDAYSGLFGEYDIDDEYYELAFQKRLNIPVEFKGDIKIVPTARDVVDTCVNNTDVTNARIFVNKRGVYDVADEEAKMMRKIYAGILYRTNLDSKISPWRVGAKYFWLYGLAVFKTVWDADRWPDKPIQKKGESEEAYAIRVDTWRHETHKSIPIIIQPIHPRCIMPDPSGEEKFVIEKRKRIVFDVDARYGKVWKNPKGRELGEEVDQYSIWTPKYRCEIVDGESILPIKVVEHKYGFLPYTIIDGGLGNITHDNDVKKRYVGILRYVRDMLISESRNYTIFDVILAKESWKGGILRGEPADLAQIKMSNKYGEWDRVPSNVTIEKAPEHLPPDALNTHLYRTTDYLTSFAAPRSVRGLSEQGVRSGADRRLVISQASARFQYSKPAFSNGAAQVLTNCARLIKDVIPGSVRVYARTPVDEFDIVIDKGKMKEPFTCSIEFAPISEEDEYTRHDDLERQIQSGLISVKTARKQLTNIDPETEELEQEKQKLKDSPALDQMIQQYAAGLLAQKLAAKGMVNTMAGGGITGGMQQPGGPMMGDMIPPTAERAPEGSPAGMQQQLKRRRSGTPMFPMQGFGGGGRR